MSIIKNDLAVAREPVRLSLMITGTQLLYLIVLNKVSIFLIIQK
jgi:hypothetical protein